MEMTGIILAGGKSSRFGEDKGLFDQNNTPMILPSLEVAKQFCSRVIIISNDHQYEQFGWEVFEDVKKSRGPLGGIYTGLLHSKSQLNLILSCDIPMINNEIIEKLVENHSGDVSVVKEGNRIHPLIGIYDKNVAPIILKSIDKGELKVMNALEECRVTYVTIEGKLTDKLVNINSKEDLEKWQTK